MVILNCIIITVLLKYFDQIDTALVSTKGDYKILDWNFWMVVYLFKMNAPLILVRKNSIFLSH